MLGRCIALVGASLAVPVSIAGCSLTRCSITGPSWPDHVGPWPPSQDAYPPHAELRLGHDGTTEWRGSGLGLSGDWRRVGRDELSQLLAITDTMPTRPYIVVEVSPGADCRTVRSIAAELESLSLCREGLCLERTAWETYSPE